MYLEKYLLLCTSVQLLLISSQNQPWCLCGNCNYVLRCYFYGWLHQLLYLPRYWMALNGNGSTRDSMMVVCVIKTNCCPFFFKQIVRKSNTLTLVTWNVCNTDKGVFCRQIQHSHSWDWGRSSIYHASMKQAPACDSNLTKMKFKCEMHSVLFCLPDKTRQSGI